MLVAQRGDVGIDADHHGEVIKLNSCTEHRAANLKVGWAWSGLRLGVNMALQAIDCCSLDANGGLVAAQQGPQLIALVTQCADIVGGRRRLNRLADSDLEFGGTNRAKLSELAAEPISLELDRLECHHSALEFFELGAQRLHAG
ncbi:unannotated protein [freshwater metagenome]|uniref:Unannotated protein n=1 Tax=freshwater metagenome TaxID=449393 RepID=A0A6J6P567_9ZZZZ